MHAYVDHLTEVEPHTKRKYRAYIGNDVALFKGHLPLEAVTQFTDSAWVSHLEETGNSGKAIANKHGFFAAAMAAAARMRPKPLIAYNLCIGGIGPRPGAIADGDALETQCTWRYRFRTIYNRRVAKQQTRWTLIRKTNFPLIAWSTEFRPAQVAPRLLPRRNGCVRERCGSTPSTSPFALVSATCPSCARLAALRHLGTSVAVSRPPL
ncbi:hypothetical protein [Nocardia sp. CA-119907]|uniref:hypothetical protein n=1 Tax=Nocardia sp. CA-119907 TaxID=3239973 RepID=UPI003D991BEF